MFYNGDIGVKDKLMENQVIAKLRRPLFQQGASLGACDNVTNLAPYKTSYLAVTINPDPFVLMNRKKYSDYSSDKQRDMLLRMEAAFRRENPQFELLEIYFETCPSLKQIHFHALYKIDSFMLQPMNDYWATRVCRKNSPSWEYLCADEVYHLEGWQKYIRKEQPK